MALEKPTRQQVVERAEYYFDRCAYVYTHFVGTFTPCWCTTDGSTHTTTQGYTVQSGPYFATDCSGYTSWCWFLKSHHWSGHWISGDFARNYKPRTKIGDTIEESFSGIQIGDVLARPRHYKDPLTGKEHREGHVAIYVGNNTILHAATKSWRNTSSQHGMNRQQGTKVICAGYQGVCSYDSTWSEEYDPDEIPDPVPDWNQSDGKDGEPATHVPLVDEDIFEGIIAQNTQYTKKYVNMKLYRRF